MLAYNIEIPYMKKFPPHPSLSIILAQRPIDRAACAINMRNWQAMSLDKFSEIYVPGEEIKFNDRPFWESEAAERHGVIDNRNGRASGCEDAIIMESCKMVFSAGFGIIGHVPNRRK